MTYPLMLRELVIDLPTGEFSVNRIDDPRIIGPVDYGWSKYHNYLHMTGRRDPELMTFGGGPLAGSRIPGTRRLVFCSYSPLWDGFYISSMGGAAYIMHRVGVDFVTLQGAAPQDSSSHPQPQGWRHLRASGAHQPRSDLDRLRQPGGRALDRILRASASCLR